MKVSKAKIKLFNEFYDMWVKILKNEIASLWAIMVYYVGKKGSGKSYGAIRDALSLDPKFTAKQILFRKDEVIEFIDKFSYTGGKVAIWDEFGSEMHAREWFKTDQRQMIQLLEVIRETDLTFMVCLPHLIFGDSSVEALANFCVELYAPKHRDDPYRVGKALEIHGLYSKRAKMEFKPLWLEGKIFHIPYLDPRKSNAKLFRDYHKKKSDYVKWMIEQSKNKESETGLSYTQLKYLKEFNKDETVSSIATKYNVSESSVKEMKRKLRRKGALN